MLTGEDIRARLTAFAARWSVYPGGERGEAQTFLNELFECYGRNRLDSGARFEEPQKGRFPPATSSTSVCAASRRPCSTPKWLRIAELLVRPERERGYQENYRAWWRFARPLPAMRAALDGLTRYVVGTAQGKRIHFCWADSWTCPSNLVTVFAFDDDYSIGILNSTIHGEWARLQGSTLEDRIRYTPQTSFGTFPWPAPSSKQRDKVADVARTLLERPQAITVQQSFGLTRLYNLVDDGGFTELRKLHDELDRAVADAYGWPRKASSDAELSNHLLLHLNLAIASGRTDYAPFANPEHG